MARGGRNAGSGAGSSAAAAAGGKGYPATDDDTIVAVVIDPCRLFVNKLEKREGNGHPSVLVLPLSRRLLRYPRNKKT